MDRCTPDDVKTAITELRTGQRLSGTHHETFPMRPEQSRGGEQDARLLPLDLAGGHARRPALPVERQDAVRQDLHRLPARQEARRQEGARRHVQAGGGGRLADRSGVPCRLRRLAVPVAASPAATRRRSITESRLSTSGRSRTCSAGTRTATSRPRTSGFTWSTGTWLCSTSTTSAHGATPPRSCSRARTTRSRRRRLEARVRTPLWRPLTKTSSELSARRDRLPADHHEGLPLPLRDSVRGAGDWRVHRGADLQLDLHRRAAGQGGVRREEPGQGNPYAALPQMRLLTYQMPDELIAIASAGRVRRVRPERVLRRHWHEVWLRSSSTRTTFRSGSTSSEVRYSATQVDNLKLGSQRPPFPYSDVRLLPYLQHSFWFLPNVAACHAMANLLAEKQNVFWHDYTVLPSPARQPGSASMRCRRCGRL